jgi:hypothetical protein
MQEINYNDGITGSPEEQEEPQLEGDGTAIGESKTRTGAGAAKDSTAILPAG